MKRVIVLCLLILTACQPAASKQVTGLQVIDQFTTAGLAVSDVAPGERAEGTPLPNTYTENLTFVIAEVAPKGGQVFICETKEYCDALMAYFDALKALAGPYLYQSPSGRVVVQLNSGLSTTTAERFRGVVADLP